MQKDFDEIVSVELTKFQWHVIIQDLKVMNKTIKEIEMLNDNDLIKKNAIRDKKIHDEIIEILKLKTYKAKDEK